jgi:dihydroorotase
MYKTITIIRPDDWHLHVRDGAMLRTVLPASAEVFGRAIIMPNLRPPVTTAKEAERYRNEILAALPAHSHFTPLMTAYLTDSSDADDLAAGHAAGIFTAVKLYPANATTNSAQGVTDIKRIYPVLERLQTIKMPLLIHGEVTDPEVDIFDREAVFLDRVLSPLLRDFPALKIVLEHATTTEAVEFVAANQQGSRLGATITAHHLHINRNAIFMGGIRPHYYCLPVAKRERHRLSLIKAATSGAPYYFLGTDSAPHPKDAKETGCGCAGIFTAPLAMQLYATIFAAESKLDQLEAFASRNGSAFYELPLNQDTITLRQTLKPISPLSCMGAENVTPFASPLPVDWEILKIGS